jgi:oligopeptide transport system substrate-binding protein
MKRRFTAILLTLAMVLTLLVGCGTKDDSTKTTSDTTNETKATDDKEATDDTQDAAVSLYPGTPGDKEVVANIATEPADMRSVTTTDTISLLVLTNIMENLVSLDENDEVIPGCAESWDISEDGLTYKFKIREGMKWTNGEAVTAKDFEFAWKTLLDPNTASEYAYIAYFIKNAQKFNEGEVSADEVGVKATSDYELEVTLEAPTDYAIKVFAFGVMAPVNEKAYKEIGESYGTDADKIVTNGAYKMTSWEHENKIILEKNTDYWNANAVECNKVTLAMINDSNAVLNAYKAGEVDIAGVTGDQVTMLKSEGEPTYTYNDGSCFYLEYNMAQKELQNENLRKALSYAIDSQSFVTSIIKNDSKIATGFVPDSIAGLNDKFAKEVGQSFHGFDPDLAKESYQKALEELGVDSVSLTMICDDGDQAQLYAAFIQEQIKTNLGLEIKVEAMPFKSRLERMTNKDFSIVFAGWGPDYNDPLTFLDMFETGNGNNHTSYSDAAYDELLNKVRSEVDSTARMGYLYELEKKLMTDLPIGPIYWRSRDYVVSGKIASGVVRSAFQDMNLRYIKFK